MNSLKILLLVFAASNFGPTPVEGIKFGSIAKAISRKVFFFLSNCTSGAGEPRLLFYSPYENATGVRLQSLRTVNLNSSLETVFLIHGFLSHGTKDWVNDTTSALLQNKPRNIFVVDWRLGACSETISYLNFQSYSAAAANTKAIGDYVARCIEILVDYHSVRSEHVWIIGHSLGAHVAGFAGKALRANRGKKLGRITGLDPAGPRFRGLNSTSRLDKTDAIFVEVTHTSSLLGLQEPVGDVDIYYNGGEFQRSCILSKPGCSHDRSVDYYIEAIRNSSCPFMAKAWSRDEGYLDTPTSYTDCFTIVGPLAADCYQRGTFYVQTNTREPYCTGELPSSGEIVESPDDLDPMDDDIFDASF